MDQSYWQKRYENQDAPWNIGSISTPIREYIDQISDKNLKILIPGAGFGYEAAYLHQQGFTAVFVLDFVQEALDHFKTLNPDFPKENLVCADFFSHTGSYDLILEQTLFCALEPKKRTAYVSKIAELLKTGGKLVGVLFNRDFEGGPPFGGNREEYEKLFQQDFQIRTMELCYNSILPRAGTELFVIFDKK